MKYTIRTIDSYNGFSLNEPIEFEGYLCAITGKNGVGKTRLLESILNNKSQIFIDESILYTNQIEKINIDETNVAKLNHQGSHELNDKVATEIIKKIERINNIDDIPEHAEIYLYPGNSHSNQPTFSIREILIRACTFFKKELATLTLDELKLSMLIHNDLHNSQSMIDYPKRTDSLGQLTVNYFSAIYTNEHLSLINSRNRDICFLDKHTLHEKIGDESPHEKFNEIIRKIFRGKFKLLPPDTRSCHLIYSPKLALANSEQEVKLEALSSGEKNILWLALKTFEIKTSSLEENFKSKKTFILDEPDRNLHPQMIVDFFDCLKSLHEELNVNFIFSTHSPTTIALIPSDNIFTLESNEEHNKYCACKVEKDIAISSLLDGITQIAINPKNSRQIYVENKNDSSIYAEIYRTIKRRSKKKIIEIPINFISSGPKIAATELQKHIDSVLKETDDSLKKSLIETINGSGDCGQVIGMVSHLIDSGNTTVRGIIDWDVQDREHPPQVKVFAKNYAYSIENVVYDPISLFALTMHLSTKNPSDYFDCDDDYHWKDALSDKDKLQEIVDVITKQLLGRENKKDHDIKYMGGIILKGDRKYFIPRDKVKDPALIVMGREVKNGHDLESVISEKFMPEIKKIHNKTSKQPLIYHFTKRITIDLLGPDFISCAFEDLFSEID
ncbi:Predicted ATP-binding protein involved in virulence [Klebsiella variicola]|uniref:AAA family ATPase n=1 Tax=Klebsiella variicola TaxID=244366 RepID=UPI0009BC0360|nr:AAA family ATPase [Klebsiella variicola]SLY63107.1 Predicted ATP-binding protein involved in virulence [Klebsiella variicola]